MVNKMQKTKRVQFSNDVRVKYRELNNNSNRYISVVILPNKVPKLGNNINKILARGNITKNTLIKKKPQLMPLKTALKKETQQRANKRREKLIKNFPSYKAKDKALFDAISAALKEKNTVTPSEISQRTWRKNHWLGPTFIKDWMAVQKHGYAHSLRKWGFQYNNGIFKKARK